MKRFPTSLATPGLWRARYCSSGLLLHNATLDVLSTSTNDISSQDNKAATLSTKKGPNFGAFSSTKIVATIGPSSTDETTLATMMQEGLDVARLNFSHGSFEEHTKRYNFIRLAAAKFGNEDSFSIALDTKGPEIRTFPNATQEDYVYAAGATVKVHLVAQELWQTATSTQFRNTKDDIYIAYPPCDELQAGSTILIADGQAELIVTSIATANSDGVMTVSCDVVCGCSLGGRNNAHFPGVCVSLPALSETDKRDIAFGVGELGVDFIFASFARSGEHIETIKRIAAEAAAKNETRRAVDPAYAVPVIAKVENTEGLKNIEDIIAASDGVMIARGDLGMDIPLERMFMAQKMIAAKSSLLGRGKPVICATQMLESMVTHPRPTRAEATDVANAVLDGVDAVMLSGESAKGKFPVEAVRMMRHISSVAESTVRSRDRFLEIGTSVLKKKSSTCNGSPSWQPSTVSSIANSAVMAAFDLEASCILTTTVSGDSVRMLARLRPPCPIVAVCFSLTTCRSLSLCSGVIPVLGKHVVGGGEDEGVVNANDLKSWESNFETLVGRSLEKVVRPLLANNQLPQSSQDGAFVVMTNTDVHYTQDYERFASMSVRRIES